MNAKTMSAILEHMDAKSVRICMLDEKLRKADEMFRQWKTLLGLDAKLTGPQVEEAISGMMSALSTFTESHKQYFQLTRTIDDIALLRGEPIESHLAYVGRLSALLRDADARSVSLARLADERFKELAELQGTLAKLETRESELNALHDAIESLPGFPMQPQESYAAYLQRLAADRAQLAADKHHLLTSTAETTQRLRDQLDGNNQQYTESRATIANLEAQLAEASKERDNFRARWEESLAERDRAVDEARRTSEANQALRGEVTLRSQILARIMIDPSTDKLFNDRNWNAAARKVLIEARGMVSDTPNEHARERYVSEVKEMLRPYAE